MGTSKLYLDLATQDYYCLTYSRGPIATMWSLFFLCCLTVPGCNSRSTSIPLEVNNTDSYILVDHQQNKGRGVEKLTGCPAKIPITENKKIVAGRIYYEVGNGLPELSCN